MQRVGHRRDEPLHELLHLLGRGLVKVLQHQQEGPVQPGHLGGQDLQPMVERGPIPSRDESGGFRKPVRGRGLDGSDEVADEALRVVVERINREPGAGRAASIEPLGDQRRLSEARRGGDESHPVLGGLVESLEESGALLEGVVCDGPLDLIEDVDRDCTWRLRR